MDSKITRFIENSEKRLEEISVQLKEERENIVSFLKENFIDSIDGKNIIIQDRIKDKKSLREKIIRKNYFSKYNDYNEFIDNLPDLIGIRIVCLLEKEEKSTFKKIKEIFSEELEDNYSIIKGTKECGKYFKINVKGQPTKQKNNHNIYKMDGQWVNNGKNTNVELQIKSLVHTFWGEIEHMLFYKNYAYMMNQQFYKRFMESTFEILHTVDYQLEIMKEQLKFKNEYEQIDEIKQMATRILYNTYQIDARGIFKCNIDLKEAFEFISVIYFKNITSKDRALSKINNLITIINSRNSNLDEGKLNFEKYEIQKCNLNEESKGWVKKIVNLIESKDVYWNTFFAVYRIVENQKTTNDLINEIVSTINDVLNVYKDEFEEGIDGITKVCSRAINKGLLKSFIDYEKIDFFSSNENIKDITDNVRKFVIVNQQDIYELSNKNYTVEQEEFLDDLISTIIKVKILLIINKKIPINELKELNRLIDSEKNIFGHFGVNIERLQNYIAQGETTINLNEYNNIFE